MQRLYPLPHRGPFLRFCKQSRPRSGSSCKSCLIRVYSYGNMLYRNLTSSFFVLCTCADPEGGPRVRTSPPPEKSQRNIGVLEKSVSIQCWAIIGTPANHHFVSPLKWCFADRRTMAHFKWHLDHHSPRQLKKTLSKLDPL